jgi:hypothetical protein
MKKELQDKLFEKYPKIFRQKDLPMKETCMCWGIECGDGWYMLIDKLCSNLQWNIDHNNHSGRYPQIEAVQVKEKFGGLRFYVQGDTDAQTGAIDFAESLSYEICENCGSTDNVSQTKGWITTFCKKCMDENTKRREENT